MVKRESKLWQSCMISALLSLAELYIKYPVLLAGAEESTFLASVLKRNARRRKPNQMSVSAHSLESGIKLHDIVRDPQSPRLPVETDGVNRSRRS